MKFPEFRKLFKRKHNDLFLYRAKSVEKMKQPNNNLYEQLVPVHVLSSKIHSMFVIILQIQSKAFIMVYIGLVYGFASQTVMSGIEMSFPSMKVNNLKIDM